MLIRPDLLLRLEALFVLCAALLCYSVLHGSWLLFAVLFFVPDLPLLGYVAKINGRAAAMLYNFTHCYAVPSALGLIVWNLHAVRGEQLAAIWIAHIAFDRTVGAGLKYPQVFRPTHIQMTRFYRP
jgi:hypothetical protein